MQPRAARCVRAATRMQPSWRVTAAQRMISATASQHAPVLPASWMPLAAPRRLLASCARPLCSDRAAPSASDASPAADPAPSASVADAELDDPVSPADLSRAYFPYTALPPAFPLQGFPLARIAFGGTSRPGNTTADARAAVKSYMRLGGNLVEMTRGFSFDVIDASQELLQENKIPGEVILCASVSSQDLLNFISTEQDRWRLALQKKNRGIPQATPAVFVSELLPSGVAMPTTARQLLPLLPSILPAYLAHFLPLHELDCLDTLLLEPPVLNTNPDKVPAASFEWMGGVDTDLTLTQEDFIAFVQTWFEALEQAVRDGSIKSYGITSARFTLMPTPAAAPVKPSEVVAAADPPVPTPSAPHGSQYYVPLDRILQAARDASRKAGPNPLAEPGATPKEHHLSTLKFPFSLFNAHKLLYPPTAATPTSSPSSSSPTSSAAPSSFFDTVRREGLLTLGDLPFEDSEPAYAEWVRFMECAPRDSRTLLKLYKESMQKVTNLEYVYKLLVDDSKLTEAELPPRIPDCSWGGLIHAHQNDVYNIVTWESLLHRRIRPSLGRSLPRLKSFASGPNHKLADWAVRYGMAAPEACKRFGEAVEHTTNLLNEKINERLVSVLPRLSAFPSLEAKCLLILLSTPIHALITDLTASYDLLATAVAKERDLERARAAEQGRAVDLASADVPTMTSELPRYLLNAEELRAVLDCLQTDVATMLPARVMNDEMRKKKPTTIM